MWPVERVLSTGTRGTTCILGLAPDWCEISKREFGVGGRFGGEIGDEERGVWRVGDMIWVTQIETYEYDKYARTMDIWSAKGADGHYRVYNALNSAQF